nr:nuclear transport factor 2 family protein [Streptomyces violaceusniger]
MTAATRDLFERYHACWESRDPDRIAGLHTADSVFHLHSGQDPVRGQAAIREAAAGMFELVPELGVCLGLAPRRGGLLGRPVEAERHVRGRGRDRHRPRGLRPGRGRRGEPTGAAS